jgi:hypothetical protein
MSTFDREDDLALDVAFGGSFVCLASVGKRIGAVQDDADRPVIEQAPDFRQLSPARTDLGCRDRDAQRNPDKSVRKDSYSMTSSAFDDLIGARTAARRCRAPSRS